MAHNHIATHVVVHHNAECPATLDGLEPPTLCFGGKDSIHLRYRVKDVVAELGFEPRSPAYEAGGVSGLPHPAIEKCARCELNTQPIGYQPIAPTVVLLAHVEAETTH